MGLQKFNTEANWLKTLQIMNPQCLSHNYGSSITASTNLKKKARPLVPYGADRQSPNCQVCTLREQWLISERWVLDLKLPQMNPVGKISCTRQTNLAITGKSSWSQNEQAPPVVISLLFILKQTTHPSTRFTDPPKKRVLYIKMCPWPQCNSPSSTSTCKTPIGIPEPVICTTWSDPI